MPPDFAAITDAYNWLEPAQLKIASPAEGSGFVRWPVAQQNAPADTTEESLAELFLVAG